MNREKPDRESSALTKLHKPAQKLLLPALLLFAAAAICGLLAAYTHTEKAMLYYTPIVTDAMGWEFYTVENGLRRPLTTEELLETGGVFYLTQVLPQSLEDAGYTVLLFSGYRPSAVFLDGALLYTNCPDADLQPDQVAFPPDFSMELGRGEKAGCTLPSHYAGRRLTIATMHSGYPVMPGVYFTSYEIETETSMTAANRYMIPAVVFFVFSLLLSTACLAALRRGLPAYSYLPLILAALLQAFSSLRFYSFISPAATPLDHPLALLVPPLTVALPLVWLLLQMQNRRGRMIFGALLAVSAAVSLVHPVGTICGVLPFYSAFLESHAILFLPILCLLPLALREALEKNPVFRPFLLGLGAVLLAVLGVYAGSLARSGYYAGNIACILQDPIALLNWIGTVLFGLTALTGLYHMLLRILRTQSDLAVQTERTRLLDMQLAAQQQFYEARLSQEEEVRSLRHDMDGHLRTLQALLGDGRHEEAKDYLSALDRQHHAQPQQIFSQNPYINAVLRHYAARCQENGIPLVCQTGVDQQRLPVTELCLILNNALENAVEASLSLPPSEREIKLQAAVRQGRFLLRVTNRFAGELSSSGPLPATSKGGKEHGYGLANIHAAAQRKGGSMAFRCENGCFVLDVEFQV